jgi:hypothetical protein
VPWFVAWIDDEPDFRIIGTGKIGEAVEYRRCWICGDTLGGFVAYTIGAMCAVNRVSAEPPSHRECAIYAARACPFLSKPNAKRRTAKMPDEVVDLPGEALRRNPGVALVWVTRDKIKRIRTTDGYLFYVGKPVETLWYRESRAATRAEVEASIESGAPTLRGLAQAEGERALADLRKMLADAEQYLPEEDAA